MPDPSASASFPRRARIVIDFLGFWVAGTGGGAGRAADVRCHRDRRGLPALPMSQVKGTLREAAERLAAAGATVRANGAEVAIGDVLAPLFGGRSPDDGPVAAALRTGEDATLDPAVDWGPPEALFVRHAATAISEAGVADDRTLRTVEAAVPLPLAGTFDWIAPMPPGFDWVAALDAIAAATPAFGKLKADGYGRAIARVEPLAAAAAAGADAAPRADAAVAADEVAGGAPRPEEARPGAAPAARAAAGGAAARRAPRVLELFLWPTRRATFSARSATEGAHQSRKGPTGSALLGWCAAGGRYERFQDPFAVFHSGAVRFGDALPWAGGAEVVPVPKSFTAPKGSAAVSKDPATGEDILDPAVVRVGRPVSDADRAEAGAQQYEGLDGAWVSTGDFRPIRPAFGQRLRTATADGRAAEGQLFGLQHLEPARGPFLARIEIGDGIDPEDQARLIAAFDGQTLHLGRAKNTGWGGAYLCRVREGAAEEGMLAAGTVGPIRVLALSDIAAVDAFGAPAPWIDPDALGLGGARFLPRDSVITLRRYAPWNAALKAHDTERQVIEAGSVLSYALEGPLAAPVPARRSLGLWQEAGLGRVWLDPPFLRAWRLTRAGAAGTATAPERPERADSGGWLPAAEAKRLKDWLAARPMPADATAGSAAAAAPGAGDAA